LYLEMSPYVKPYPAENVTLKAFAAAPAAGTPQGSERGAESAAQKRARGMPHAKLLRRVRIISGLLFEIRT
jgi:hypothetical protein